MMFSESDSVWLQTIPPWVDYLVKFGYVFASKNNDRQSFSLISMPCDSPGAGLMALGAMRYYLDASYFYSVDDIHSKLEKGKARTLVCGNNNFKYIGEVDGKAVIKEVLRPDNRRNPLNFRGEMVITRSLNDLRFENETILVSTKVALPYLAIYDKLILGGSPINEGNLKQSNSSVCLAAKRKGAKITKEILSNIRFEVNGIVANLIKLLSLVDGSLDVISRVSMYNTRTARMDRLGEPPEIVIADGIDAFLKVTEEMQRNANNEFSDCNIIAIIDRTEKREKLDSLQIKISELRQWYEPDSREFLTTPKGISRITYFKRARS